MRSRVVVAAALTLLVVVWGAALAAGPEAAQPADTNLKQVQGEVHGVNNLEGTIEVDGHAGQFPKKLVVGPDTMVTLPDGKRACLSDIREGDRVEASYRELKDGNLAEEVRLTEPAAGQTAPAGPPAQP
jgi:hypothetical protein